MEEVEGDQNAARGGIVILGWSIENLGQGLGLKILESMA